MVRSFVQDLIMLLCEVFVIEFVSVDGLAPSAIASREVSTLDHEFRDNSMELGALVAKTFLPCAQSPEVFCSLWNNLVVELELNPAKWAAVHINVEVDLSPAPATLTLTKSNCRQTKSRWSFK